MGDRISIKFTNGSEKSPVLFSHWGGIEFLREAERYVEKLQTWAAINDRNGLSPLGRMEPGRVIIDFIRHITIGMDRVDSDIYLERNEDEGDDSDNGHHILDLTQEKENKEKPLDIDQLIKE